MKEKYTPTLNSKIATSMHANRDRGRERGLRERKEDKLANSPRSTETVNIDSRNNANATIFATRRLAKRDFHTVWNSRALADCCKLPASHKALFWLRRSANAEMVAPYPFYIAWVLAPPHNKVTAFT